MASTSSKTYCTDRDLQDVFPGVSGFDLKRRLYNWRLGLTNFYDSTLDIYYLNNTGEVTELFFDGSKCHKITFNTTETTQLKSVLSAAETGSVDVDSAGALGINDIIKIDDEYMRLTAANPEVTPHTMTAATPGTNRGLFGTQVQTHAIDASIYKIVDSDVDLGDSTSASDVPSMIYDSSLDLLLTIIDTKDPNNHIIEAGDDWETIKTRFRQKASRLIESRLDAKLTKDIWYDREKNYPDIVVRLTALETIILLLSAQEPNNEFLESFKSERNELLDGLNNGTIVLPSMRTKDASEGSIRTVSVATASDLIPVELIGNYNGGGYELLKVFIDTGENGVIGTAKMTVHGKSSTKLKDGTQVLIDSEIIDGDYQHLGVGSLYIRWGGDDVTTAICTAADEYEIELYARNLGTSVAINHGTIHLTRR